MATSNEQVNSGPSVGESVRLLSFAQNIYSNPSNAASAIKSIKPALHLRFIGQVLSLFAALSIYFWMNLCQSIKITFLTTTLVACLMGIFVAISLSPSCMGAGILQIVVGVFLFFVEAPVMCRFFEVHRTIGEYTDKNMTLLVKGVLYIILAIIPPSLCFQFTSIFPGIFIALAGAIQFCSYRDAASKNNQQNSGNNV